MTGTVDPSAATNPASVWFNAKRSCVRRGPPRRKHACKARSPIRMPTMPLIKSCGQYDHAIVSQPPVIVTTIAGITDEPVSRIRVNAKVPRVRDGMCATNELSAQIKDASKAETTAIPIIILRSPNIFCGCVRYSRPEHGSNINVSESALQGWPRRRVSRPSAGYITTEPTVSSRLVSPFECAHKPTGEPLFSRPLKIINQMIWRDNFAILVL
jgi:hypothetical protein